MFLRVFLLMTVARAATSCVVRPIVVPEVAGLRRIRKAGKQQILARVSAIKTAFDAAADAAKPCPLKPDFKACKECIRDKCTERAKKICYTSQYFGIKYIIDEYADSLLASEVVPEAPNFDATEAEIKFNRFKSAVTGEKKFNSFKPAVTGVAARRKRAAENPAPYCEELKANATACGFYISQCSCSLICPGYDKVVAAKKAFEDAVNNYLDFNIKQLTIKLGMVWSKPVFNPTAGFSYAVAKIQIGGGERILMVKPIACTQPN